MTSLVIFPAWQSTYNYIGPFNGYGFSTVVILAGYWQTIPGGWYIAWLTANTLQLAMAIVGLGRLIYLWLKTKSLVGANQPTQSVDLETVRTSSEAVVGNDDDAIDTCKLLAAKTSLVREIIPLLLFSWQIVVGLIAYSVVFWQVSGVTTALIFTHASLEFMIVILRFMLLGDLTEAKLIRAVKLLLIFFGALTFVFMLSGDVYYRAAFGGIALLTDFGNFFVSPFVTAYLWYYRGPSALSGKILVTSQKLFWLDLSAMIISVIHVLIFYPAGLAAGLGHLEVAAGLSTVFAWLNLIALLSYIIVTWRA